MGLLNQIAVNSLYRFLFLLFQFFITIFISRLVGPDGLGTYSLILANANILLVFTSLGIPAGLTYHSAKNDISEKALFRIALISAAIQFAAILLIETVYRFFTGKFLIWPARELLPGIAGLFFFLSHLITERYGGLYNGRKQFHRFNLQLAIFSLLAIGPLFFWMISDARPNEFNVIAVLIITGMLQAISLGFFYTRINSPDVGISERTASRDARFFSYSLLAWLANSLQFLVYRIDFWILYYFHGGTELGLYALAVRFSQTFWIIPGLMSTVILPHMTSLQFDRSILERIIRLTNTVNLIGAVVIAAMVWDIIPFIFGTKFSGSSYTLILLLPGTLFVSMHTFLAAYFAAQNKIGYNLRTSILTLIIITVLDFTLIPGMGRNGAAIASSIAYTTGAVYAMMLYVKMVKYPAYRLLIQKQDLVWLQNNISRFGLNGKVK